jgi:hypothetical protein
VICWRVLVLARITTEAGEKATQYPSVFAASFVLFVLACVRKLFTTWPLLGSIQKVAAYLGARVVNPARFIRSCAVHLPGFT